MPRRKKRAHELTDEETLKKLFPAKVRREAKEKALGSQKKSTKKDSN